jgi:hypothetical protein
VRRVTVRVASRTPLALELLRRAREVGRSRGGRLLRTLGGGRRGRGAARSTGGAGLLLAGELRRAHGGGGGLLVVDRRLGLDRGRRRRRGPTLGLAELGAAARLRLRLLPLARPLERAAQLLVVRRVAQAELERRDGLPD